ncbi:MAG: preprotein translocase subunit SecY [Sphingomonadaceae bacterium]|nr:preprotein translocase subunit SecY [Sphingomonadaceae bacterium]
MATSANFAAGLSLSNFAQATELKQRIWFTLGALIIFRLLSFVPLPGIDPVALQQVVDITQQNTGGGGILNIFNTFAGGSLERMSLIALGVMPYITASIVVQMAAALSPTLAAIKKEGESGRKKLNQYTRYGTVFLTAIQGYFLAVGLETLSTSQGVQVLVSDNVALFRIGAVVSLIGGTMFLMWLGEQITARGVGNGVSLIIMAGIVAQMPLEFAQLFAQGQTGALSIPAIFGYLLLILGLIFGICFMERAQRRVLIQYPKRAQARGGMQAEKSHLPLKINTAGVIPPIFASSLLLMPLTVAQFMGGGVGLDGAPATGNDLLLTITAALQRGGSLYLLLYAALIIFFCFFYTAVVFNPEETAENLKRYGGFVPGIRPGKNTEKYLDYVLTRITVVGAAYLTLICMIPEIIATQSGIMAFVLGGTSLLIVVNVTIDTVGQIQGHLMAHQYGDLIKKAKLKGRPRR